MEIDEVIWDFSRKVQDRRLLSVKCHCKSMSSLFRVGRRSELI